MLKLIGIVLVAVALPVPAASASVAHWRPPAHLTWYWQLQGRIVADRRAAVYDIDAFESSAAEVAQLHLSGKRVICYLDAGTWERWRPDARQFPRSTLGRPNGWPGERWVDIRRAVVRRLIVRRVGAQCRRKRFDAIEFDNIDGYRSRTGFPITASAQLRFNAWLARVAHSMGMAVFQKNDPEQARALQPHFDGELAEQCTQFAECGAYRPYLRAGKPVLDAEYRLVPSQFCAAEGQVGIAGARYNLALDGRVYEPCW